MLSALNAVIGGFLYVSIALVGVCLGWCLMDKIREKIKKKG